MMVITVLVGSPLGELKGETGLCNENKTKQKQKTKNTRKYYKNSLECVMIKCHERAHFPCKLSWSIQTTHIIYSTIQPNKCQVHQHCTSVSSLSTEGMIYADLNINMTAVYAMNLNNNVFFYIPGKVRIKKGKGEHS